jgi:cob(I)alamin adenosyltransferase
MVVLNRIYTRTGDDGTSALATGERRPKSDLRFAAIGTVDELNAHVGVARLHREALGPDLDAMLARIQNDLFDLGADLATPEKVGARERLRIVTTQVERLEREIDGLNEKLRPLTSFVLPGGTPSAAALHLCRTVARRAERLTVDLASRETVNPEAVHYVNRLSDFFFVAARVMNDNGASDVLWVPGKNR